MSLVGQQQQSAKRLSWSWISMVPRHPRSQNKVTMTIHTFDLHLKAPLCHKSVLGCIENKRIKWRPTHQRSLTALVNPDNGMAPRGRHLRGQTRGGRKASGHRASLWRVLRGVQASTCLVSPLLWGPSNAGTGMCSGVPLLREGPKDPSPGSQCLRTRQRALRMWGECNREPL